MKGEPGIVSRYQAVLPSPLPGTTYLGIRIEEGKVTAIDYLTYEETPYCPPAYEVICSRINRYFSATAVSPGLSLSPRGTPFQQRVWKRLQGIPSGEVMTYGALAQALNSSARAVAGACRANPIPILIPCHRVIAAHGLGGYAGETTGQAVAIKEWLLQHEGYV